MSRAMRCAAAALLLAYAPLAAQQTRTNSEWFGPTQIVKEGVTFSVQASVGVEWNPSAREGLFGENNIHVTLGIIRATHPSEILFNGKVYDQYSFGGELRSYFNALQVDWLSMSTTLSGVRNCVPFSDAVWSRSETVTRFCGAGQNVGFSSYRISDIGVSGLNALREAIRRLEREEADKERERAAEARRDSIERADRARRDSVEQARDRAQRASADSAQRAEWARRDSIRDASLSEAERQRRRDEFVRDSTRRAREDSPEVRRRREATQRAQEDYMRARARYLAQLCTRADLAYRSGNHIDAVEMYGEIRQAGPYASSCYGIAQRRISDASMTLMANSAASLISAVGQAFGVEAGFMVSSFPLPRDDLAGVAAGLTVGKGVYYADFMIGNAIFAPILSALNPVEPDFSAIGCTGPFGNDYYGNPCSAYYNQIQTESRYRVNGALTLGIVAPKGIENQIYPTVNLSYVSTDDGNLLVPAIGFIWTNHRPVRHGRYGDLYGGGGFRFAATMHQGNVGLQIGVTTSW
jgi:hypothetical protein